MSFHAHCFRPPYASSAAALSCVHFLLLKYIIHFPAIEKWFLNASFDMVRRTHGMHGQEPMPQDSCCPKQQTSCNSEINIKKNVPWHILAPRAVACDNLHLRASAHLWHVNAFLRNREFLGISSYIKKVPDIVFTMPGRNFSWCHPISQISLPRKPTAPCLRHSHSCRLHS